MRKPLSHLRWVVWNDDRPQYLIAHDAGLSESRLSRIMSGRVVPSNEERHRIAKVLRTAEATLFDHESAAGAAG